MTLKQCLRILKHGFELSTPDLTTGCAVALLSVLQSLEQNPLPRLVVVSTMGLGDTAREMPMVVRVSHDFDTPSET